MANSEDYLDGLLESINKAKTDMSDAQIREDKKREEKIARMNHIQPDDDFMEATGIKDYEPKEVSRDNLRQILSENDFLADFENELVNGDADDFIRAFEEEIDEEEAAFQRGEDIQNKSEVSFINSVFEDDEKPSKEEEKGEQEIKQEQEMSKENVMDDVRDMNNIEQEDDGDISMVDDALALAGLHTKDSPSEPKKTQKKDKDSEKASLDSLMDNVENIVGAKAKDIDESDEYDDIPVSLETSQEESEESQTKETIEEKQEETTDEEKQKDEADEETEESYLQDEFKPDEMDAQMEPLLDENAEVDLSQLLDSADESLADINNLLNADENSVELEEAREEFEESAEDMEPSLADLDETDISIDEKKGSFIQKIMQSVKSIFSKKKDKSSEEQKEEDVLEIKPDEYEDLAGENEEIIKNFEEADAVLDKKAAKKAAREEKKKAKEEKKNAKKQAKQEKKSGDGEKSSKVLGKLKEDKSPKIAPKYLFVFLLLAASMVALVLIGGNLIAAKTRIVNAKNAYQKGDYIEAYNYTAGETFKSEEDILLASKVRLLAGLQMKYRQYNTFMKLKKYDLALDALILGTATYTQNEEKAKEYNIFEEYGDMYKMLEEQLRSQFGISKKKALSIHEISDRTEYTKKINKIIKASNME